MSERSHKLIGAHVSDEPDVSFAPGYAAALGAGAFALFTGRSASWRVPDPTPEVAQAFKDNCEKFGFAPGAILPHAGFLMNLGSPEGRKLGMSRTLFVDELRRCQLLGLTMLNFHPGATLGKIDDDRCLTLIAESINRGLDKIDGVKAVIENTAGQGSNLGWSFEHIAAIIDKVEDKSRVGVCIDSCHAHAAGYDLSTAEGYERMWSEFDRVIGAQYLSAMHLNDAVKEAGSRIDRHASIGKGTIGEKFFRRLIADQRTDNIPLILETPDESLWPVEVRELYGYCPR
ncbi:MAG: deoxyribonuclease IV [Muribaculaceae bacterium]|nr:deoxyribonuclease IV [Muribaculaceae bacterium]